MLPHKAGHFWQGRWYCINRCRHDAGDRSACLGWDCRCTRYAKKRRMLRTHRQQMRIMEQLIDDSDLTNELEEELIHETGNTGFWLGLDNGQDGLDEDSDQEDPEAQAMQQVRALRQESSDRQSFLGAVQGALDHRALVSELERARMQLEDHRALGRAGPSYDRRGL